MVSTVDFRSREFLLGHIRHTLTFYDKHAFDQSGGFYHCFMNDGQVFDAKSRTLVASCRFVFNYAKAYERFGDPKYLSYTKHGLSYLRDMHRNPKTGGYAWRLVDGVVADATNHCYGLAFVMLAYASAFKAGVMECVQWMQETWEVMEQRFWLSDHGLYACEAGPEWSLNHYRGQNDNMHACEAMIAAFEASGDDKFLQRARVVAENIAVRQATLTGGQVWEHFTTDWLPALDYNRNDRSNNIRPWGVQTGHQTEWAKLLLILDRHGQEEWRIERARELFDSAVQYGWDREFGGLFYGYDLEGSLYDQDKYFWVQAESLAAAALLADRTGEEKYWEWYDRIWQYSYDHFVDHKYGAWYRLLSHDNKHYDERKSYSNKVDYHTMGACHEVLNVIGE